ncbi:unnamed protein product [Lathyrus oleraceus]
MVDYSLTPLTYLAGVV